MNFDLSEEDALLVDNVRQFCEQEVVGKAAAWDEAEAIPETAYRQLGELGLLGLEVPERYGGVELSTVASVAVIRELASASGALALGVGLHNSLAVGHIQHHGSESLRDRLLPGLADGTRLAAWAVTEPAASSDMGAIATTARRTEAGWVLRGEKTMITHGGTAGVYVVIAVTDPERGREGLTAFAVESGAPGLEVGERIHTLGVRAANTADLALRDVAVSDDDRIGGEGAAFADATALLDRGRMNVAAMSCGLLDAAMRQARDYANERKQFGRPIATFQAIQWKLADMAAELDAAWLLTLKAAFLRDAGQAHGAAAARATLFASQAAVRAASDALQIHGGYGYTREFPVERILRDAKVCQIAAGTSDALRVVASRAIVRRFAEA